MDNAIYEMLQVLLPDQNLSWDIELIGEVRDAVGEVLHQHFSVLPEEFYP